MQVNIHEAKTQLSRLLTRVEGGEEVIIAKAGKPVAKLVPISALPSRRLPGTAKGKIMVHDNFDEPLPDSVMKAFES
jgi:prevent-host-death family protein